MTINPIETTYAGCRVEGCDRPLCAKQLCRLHWERQHKTGTTDDPKPRLGAHNSNWKGAKVTYSAVHLRMSNQPRPAECQHCGATEGRFEWALIPDTPEAELLVSPQGYRYSTNPEHYTNLCKACHNQVDLGSEECRKGHPLSGSNLYIQPSNGKRFCRACQRERRRARTLRESAARSARFEHGEEG